MIAYQPPAIASSVPVIELGAGGGWSAEAWEKAARDLIQASREIGFFYVADHGVPQVLIDGELAAARAFFAQPLEAKMAIDIARSSNMRGYEPIGLQTLDEGSPPDLKESLMLGRDLGPDHPWVREGIAYEGPNQWPAALPGFREQANAYLDAIMGLGRRIGALIAHSLELPDDYFAEALVEPSCTTRMLRYPPQKVVEDNQIGCGAHTDWGFITILLQDEVGGLEVQNLAGEWIVAPPIPNTFVVNLGDMVPLLTNDFYRSTPHRVLNNSSGGYRYSIASFFNPPYSYRVECVPSCRPENGHVPEPITFAEHIQHQFQLTYGRAA